nr:hypothetical protein [Tanacetum cinerariifolium]
MLYDECGDLGTLAENLGILRETKLTGPNFIDWYRQLRVVLSIKDKVNYLEQPIPPTLVVSAGQHVAPEILTAHTTWIKGSKEIVGLMLMTMEPDIQRNLETLHAYEMLLELKTLFAQQAEHGLLQTTRDFYSCKQEEGQSASSYVLKMKGYIDNLERLGHPVTLGLGVSLILIGLRKEFDGFVQNYNMHGTGKTINEFHAMLKLHEQTLPKNNALALHAIRAGKYLAELRKKKKTQLRELVVQGLRASRKLKPGALSLYVGSGQREVVEAIDIFYLCLPSGLEIILNNCYYASSITRGVIFVSRLYEDGFINRFVNNTIQVFRNNMVYFSSIPRDGIFKIDLSNSYTNEISIYAVSNKKAKLDLDSALLWHCRLGHISKKRIKKLQHDGLIESTDLRTFEKYVSCMSGKMARKRYTHQVERAKDLLGLIHTDVCDPFKIMSRQGASYFVTFTDDFSRSWDYHHRTPPYMPQHNGVSERRNRTLLDMVRSMMSQTTLPKSFLDYALETAARILYMVTTKKVEKTAYEVWHGQAPKLSYLKVWGCEALVKRDTLTKPDKLKPRSIKCIFIGYPKETIGYSFCYPPENKVLVARNAEFLENCLITQEASGSLEVLEIIQEEDTHPSIDTSLNQEEDDLEIDEPQSDIVPIRRSIRTRHDPDRMCLYIDAEEHELEDLDEPANYKASLLDPESEKWLSVMNVEMQSIKHNEVWVLVELPPNGKTVGSKWLFKKKTDMDGVAHTYKAHLMAKGYTQTPGIDYEETFSPVADIRAIRILIDIAAYYDYEIWQMDNSKRGSTPMQEKLKLSKSQGALTLAELKRMQNVLYASTVGSSMYAVRCTRPDVAFAQNVTSRLQQNPGDLHWTTVKNILKYLRNTKDMFLTGYVFVLNSGAVDWKSIKQSIFTTSSAEAEYIAAFDASKEAIWVRKFISGLGVVPTIKEPISMYCDNTRAIVIANESGITKGARQFRAKVQYLREVIEYGDVKLEKVHTDDNFADPFTKALALLKHSEHTRNIEMLPSSSLM